MFKAFLLGSAALLAAYLPCGAQTGSAVWRVYAPNMKFAEVFGRSIEIHRSGEVISDPTLSEIREASEVAGSDALAKEAVGNLLASVAPGTGGCSTLLMLKLPWARIISAENVAAAKDARAYCKVLGVIDKEINFEVDMPVFADWNGKFMMGGNGGFLGSLQNLIKQGALHRGYATAITDTGHLLPTDGGAAWAYHHPDRVVNFGYRATHLTAANAKLVIQAFYKKAIRISYFFGASGSGRQAMMEAQRYPEDFKGIVAACPGFNWTKQGGITPAWTQQAMYPTAQDQYDYKPVIPPAKVPLLDAAVLAKCDSIDGLKDGQITNPMACKFDPIVDLKMCKSGEDKVDCFTEAQAKAIAKIHAGPSNSMGQISPGWPYGGESIPGQWTSPPGGAGYVIGLPPHSTTSLGTPPSSPYASRHYLLSNETLRYLVYNDPNYDLHDFNFETDVPDTLAAAAVVDANNPDLSAFKAHQDKLIMTAGWSDWVINPLAAKDYYDRVVRKMGGRGKISNFARLFLPPGLGHCFTPDPNSKTPYAVDLVSAIEQWVEHGKAPDSMLASHFVDGKPYTLGMPVEGKTDRTRPICAYPAVAAYKGMGSIDDAANFTCR